jgi:Rrf2 family protein
MNNFGGIEMKLSTKGRYALRIMIDLAENGEGFVPLKDIGERQNITVKYLEQIVSLLSKAQLVSGTRGNGGGYKLTKKPYEYKISEIFAASEGAFEIDTEDEGRAAEFWKGFERTVQNYLSNKTLDDVIKESKAKEREPSIWIL